MKGSECLASQIIVALNSLRFNDKFGHVVEMKEFIRQQGLLLNEIPRLLGNRLHIIFKLGGVYFSIFENLKKFILDMATKNETDEKLKHLIKEEAAIVELQVLGIMGKTLSGPWMNMFYTDLAKEQSPINTMKIVKDVIENLKKFDDPQNILVAERDFFDNTLPREETEKLMVTPNNQILFNQMMTACIKGTVEVLERQYRKSFTTVETFTEPVLASVRQHTMEAESIIGEFCEKKKVSPFAYVSSISNIIKSKRNNVWEFINELDNDQFQEYLNLAIKHSTEKNMQRKSKRKNLEAEIAMRIKEKRRKLEESKRIRFQKKLKKVSHTHSAIKAEFPDLTPDFVEDIYKILIGDIVGHRIKHVWTIDSVDQFIVGWVKEFSDPYYSILYENDGYQLDKYEMGADYLMHDLTMSYNFLPDDPSCVRQ